MNYGRVGEALMGMDDRTWTRHANPWSGWTRLASTPVWFLALWSPFWIGWYAAFPIAAMAAWTWLNPRLFPPPKTADSWMTKGVLGERVWLNRKAVPIPPGHVRAAHITTAISMGFLAITVYGLIVGDFWASLTGWHAAVLAKLWFLDRMVWLWTEMQDADPRYQAWKRQFDAPETTSTSP